MHLRFSGSYCTAAFMGLALFMTACTGYDSPPPAEVQQDAQQAQQPAAPYAEAPQLAVPQPDAPQPDAPQPDAGLLQQRYPGTMTAEHQPLREVLELLQAQTGIQFVLETEGAAPVTLSLNEPTIEDVLQQLRLSAGVEFEMIPSAEGLTIRVRETQLMAPQPMEPPLPPMEEGEVELDEIPPLHTVIQGPIQLEGMTIGYVLQTLQAQSGVQFDAGEAAERPVTLSLENPSIKDIVEEIVSEYDDLEVSALQSAGQYIVKIHPVE